jgi:hypothetical protein
VQVPNDGRIAAEEQDSELLCLPSKWAKINLRNKASKVIDRGQSLLEGRVHDFFLVLFYQLLEP